MRSGKKKNRIAVAISGASGSVYGVRVLQELAKRPELEVHVTISAAAQKVLQVEHDLKVDLEHFDPSLFGIENVENVHYHSCEDIAAPLASGSFNVKAMAIVPCSMGCVGKIASGISGNLIQRAADVMLKERRRLVIVPRETPLSAIHLENLTKLARLGVTVLPAAPGFYGRPKRVEDLVDFVVARVLDHLGLEHDLGPRWGEE